MKPDVIRPTLTLHQPYRIGTGERSLATRTIAFHHKKVVLFTSVAFIAQTCHDLERHGHKAIALQGSMTRYQKMEAVTAFNELEKGVLVASSMLREGWRVDADAVVFFSTRLSPNPANFIQAFGRARGAKEIHIIDSQFPYDMHTAQGAKKSFDWLKNVHEQLVVS